MEKYGGAREAADDNRTRRMRFACCITKDTDTHTNKHYILRFHTTMIRCVTLYVHCVCWLVWKCLIALFCCITYILSRFLGSVYIFQSLECCLASHFVSVAPEQVFQTRGPLSVLVQITERVSAYFRRILWSQTSYVTSLRAQKINCLYVF